MCFKMTKEKVLVCRGAERQELHYIPATTLFYSLDMPEAILQDKI